MTKEQEEAINILREIQDSNRAWLKETKEENCARMYLRDIEAIETVLNLLTEKDEEILQKNAELAEKSAEIAKKDKIIDLMAIELYNYANLGIVINCPCELENGNYNLENCKMNLAERNCIICIRQYFERKCRK